VRLLLATHNDHKRREFERLLAGADAGEAVALDVLGADVELPPEDGETFAENALGKARSAAAQLGRAAIADDSGIAAAALGGGPGVRSARYAGEDATDAENLAKLLAYVDPGEGVERLFEGRCTGRLAERPRGERGFGYDPAFLPDDGPPGMTMAELSDSEKDEISHRGRAARELLAWLRAG